MSKSVAKSYRFKKYYKQKDNDKKDSNNNDLNFDLSSIHNTPKSGDDSNFKQNVSHDKSDNISNFDKFKNKIKPDKTKKYGNVNEYYNDKIDYLNGIID